MKIKSPILLLQLFIVLSNLLACSKLNIPNSKLDRTVANYELESSSDNEVNEIWKKELIEEANLKNQHVEFPSGLSNNEKTKLWHMAEGSEIYPTVWMKNLKSLQTPYHKGTAFLDRLDEKFGVIKDYLPNESGYPIKWVGITATWDGENPTEQDIQVGEGEKFENLPLVKKLSNGKTTIAMTGVNCAFCHTSEIHRLDEKGNKEERIIDGGPALADVRGFFLDLVGSTVKTMLDEKELKEFLKKQNVKDSDAVAEKFSKDFLHDLGIQKSIITFFVSVLEKEIFIGDKVKSVKAQKVRTILFEKREVISNYLCRLLKITYGFDEVPELLKLRMNYLANFLAPDPDLIQTNSGHGRTDAFGRISNSVARAKNPIALTAPVSFPFMYAIKYKAMFHYNGNTNSVVTRNAGQSFGLGAILTSPNSKTGEKFASTSNLHNLIKLEKLLYKLKIPELKTLYPNEKVDKQLAVKGCTIYRSKCLGCHQAEDERVGPAKMLVNYKIPLLRTMGTDDIYIKNQMTPIAGVPFRDAIFGFTDAIKQSYFTNNKISKDIMSSWANESLRGKEVFRDTYLGDSRFDNDPEMNYVSIEKGHGYIANSLAGIWATAPYLHNGSIPNIDELLKPSNKRVKKFIVGGNEYDFQKLGFRSELKDHPYFKEKTKFSFSKNPCDENDPYCFDVEDYGNSNVGHEPAIYGGELKNNEKKELIEFLKVLTPEPEYSWSNPPIYKIVDNKCELRDLGE